MPNTERIIAQWISGAPDGPVAGATAADRAATVDTAIGSATGRTVVVDTDDWIPVLVSCGVIDSTAALLSRGGPTGGSPAGWHDTYVGSFTDAGADIGFGSGFRLRQVRYGLADFSCLDTPTALILLDEHDFSAFLRDADAAWSTGTFANHVTHPFTVLANVAALGAPAGRSGPEHRFFVAADGAVSTSPFGAALGQAGDHPALVADRWRAAHLTEAPDAVSLRAVVRSADRSDALSERPWLARYFQVAAAIRAIRAEHLQPGRVSGFSALPARSGSGAPDPDRPVLVEVGSAPRVVDPATGAWTALGESAAMTARRLLDGSGPVADDQVRALSVVLADAGLPTGWLPAAVAVDAVSAASATGGGPSGEQR